MKKDFVVTILIFLLYMCVDIFTPVNNLKSDIVLGLFSALISMTKTGNSITRVITFTILCVGSYTCVIYFQGIGNINKISSRFPDIAARWWKGIWVADIKIVAIIVSVAILCSVFRKVCCRGQHLNS